MIAERILPLFFDIIKNIKIIDIENKGVFRRFERTSVFDRV